VELLGDFIYLFIDIKEKEFCGVNDEGYKTYI
jgi:hypothetical protein